MINEVDHKTDANNNDTYKKQDTYNIKDFVDCFFLHASKILVS
jgi:hypothetical protein